MIEYSVTVNGGSFEGNKIKDMIDKIGYECTEPGYEYTPSVQLVYVTWSDKEREFDDQSGYVKLLQRKIDNQIENINNE
tara:strand:- start:95 stop:331 length:237 start_codon:yes stop_codon:yes gene_type:complete